MSLHSSSPSSSPEVGLQSCRKRRLSFGIESILDPSFGQADAKRENTIPTYSPTPTSSVEVSPTGDDNRAVFPAWVFCTRYSDRPSAVSGPRSRKPRKRETPNEDEKRPRTAFTSEQLERLKKQFVNNRYLTEKRRQELAHELGLNESQIKIWFQNKRAKLKKANIDRPSSISLHLMAQSIYNQ